MPWDLRHGFHKRVYYRTFSRCCLLFGSHLYLRRLNQTPTQVFSCKCCKIFKNNFYRTRFWFHYRNVKSTCVFTNISKSTFITIKKDQKMQNGCCISLEKYFFTYKFVLLLTRVTSVHKIPKIHFVNYAKINAIHIFEIVVIRATGICLLWPVIAVNRLQQGKTAPQRRSEK